MRKLRVLALMDESLVPPDNIEGVSDEDMLDWKSEYDVVTTLGELNHDVMKLGVSGDLGVLTKALLDYKPQIIFNLLEEFHGVALYDQHVAAFLELMKQPYTGCNPRGLMLAHDKVLCKKILHYHRIPTPRFAVYPRGKKVRPTKRLQYPLFVKSATEDASYGLTKDSLVHDEKMLIDRVWHCHEEIGTDALVEEYITGREFYVGVMGNDRLAFLPVWELLMTKLPDGQPNIATDAVKWDFAHQKKLGVKTEAATDLTPATTTTIVKLCKRVYRALSMSGYARMDLRMTAEGEIFVLEANPNPNLSYGEDFAESADKTGISYRALVQRIVNLGLRYRPPWKAE
jgi:D-alanine-D-alanine ligase